MTTNQKIKSLNSYFDKIYCINLKKRMDRWEETVKIFREHRLIVDRFEAIDGDNIIFDNNKMISPGEYGCLMSHLNIIHNACINGYDKILIFEDDIELHENFNEISIKFMEEVPSNWDMIYFGANTINNKSVAITEHVSSASRLLGGHAYGVNSRIFHYLMEKICNEPFPVDKIYSDQHIYMNTFLCNPIVVWQRQGWSDINNKFVDYNFLRENK